MGYPSIILFAIGALRKGNQGKAIPGSLRRTLNKGGKMERITWANKSGETWEMTAQELERLLDAVKAAKLHGHGEVAIDTEWNLEINNNG